jgi:hypothetical protein
MNNKDHEMNDVHLDFFSNATQSVFTLIEKALRKNKCVAADFNDFYYFGSIFLGVLASRLDQIEKARLSLGLCEMLQEAANDGVIMCNEIMTANLATKEERNNSVQRLIMNLKGKGFIESSALVEVSQETHSLSINTDSVWQPKSDLNYSTEFENEMVLKFETLIDQTLDEIPFALKKENKPESLFIVNAIINIGLMIGYSSVLYKQPLNESIVLAVKKINEFMKIYSKNNHYIN